MRLTLDLNTEKKRVREQCRGTTRYGMPASSGIAHKARQHISSRIMSMFKRKGNKLPGRKGRWYKEEHLFGSVTYRCSNCGAKFKDCRPVCSKCGSQNSKARNDPVWVDEMSEYDLE